jgi:hypothetical protein
MSLKQFLAVGRSFVGIRDTKSPYELRKENLLPRFGGVPRVHSSEQMVQGDWVEQQKMDEGRELLSPERGSEELAEARVSEQGLEGAKRTEASSGASGFGAHSGSAENISGPNPFTQERAVVMGVKGRGKVRRHRGWLNLLTFGLLGRVREQQPLVQAELSLDRIKVVRNDLADSDLELVLKKKKKKASLDGQSGKAAAPARWSKLTARLFEMGQEH